MSEADDLRRLALALEGTVEAAHFDRRAFRVRRIYATLAADGKTANLMLTPDEQALKVTVAPEAFSALNNKWGERGATEMRLHAVSEAELAAALEMAWRHALDKRRG